MIVDFDKFEDAMVSSNDAKTKRHDSKQCNKQLSSDEEEADLGIRYICSTNTHNFIL